jgi:hypothetical protein
MRSHLYQDEVDKSNPVASPELPECRIAASAPVSWIGISPASIVRSIARS